MMKIITISLIAMLLSFTTTYAQYNYGSVAYNEVMDLEDQITIEAWVKVEELPEGSGEFWQNQDYIFIISQSNDGSSVGNYSFGFNKNRLFFAFSTLDSRYSVPLETQLEVNTWTHLAVSHTFGNGAGIKTFVNGVETNQGTWYDDSGNIIGGNGMPWPDDPHTEYFVGDCIHYSYEYNSFYGVMDELRIWNAAHNETEIQSTMNIELNGDETDLIAYWNFNDIGNSTQTDLTSNNLPLIVMNDAEVILSNSNGTSNGALRLYTSNSGFTSTELDNGCLIYPNPADEQLNIDIAGVLFSSNQEFVVNLIDCMGKNHEALFSIKNKNTIQVDISNLNPGIYFMQLVIGDENMRTSKVIVK